MDREFLLMTRFYQYLTDGAEMVTAFNHAVTDLRKMYPEEPAKWAAFVVLE